MTSIPRGVNDREQEDSRGLATGGILVAALLGQAIHQNNGAFSPMGVLFIAISICISAVSVFKSGVYIKCISARGLCPLLAAILSVQFAQLLTNPPGIYIRATNQDWMVFVAIGVCAAFLTAIGLSKDPVFGRFGFVLLLGSFVFLAVWVLYLSPNPQIDVFYFQRDSIGRLLELKNPYAYHFKNIYSHNNFYGPELVRDGVLQFGYPYLPLDLIAVIPGYLIGDIRSVMVFAIGCTGLIFARLQPGPLGRALAALYWFSPRTLFVVEQAWIEPLIVFCAALLAISLKKFPKSTGWVAGLLLASKQTMLWMPYLLPLLFIGKFKNWWRVWILAVILAAGTCVPFFVWNPKAFWFSTISLQVLQPFRPDALSFPAFFYQIGIPWGHWAAAFPASIACIAFSLWRSSRTTAGWAMSTCLTYTVFFAFNKQAFCNYYFMVIGFACLAVASVRIAENDDGQEYFKEKSCVK